LAIRLRRRAYRTAYVVLRVYWFIARPNHRGVKCVLTDGGRVLLVRHTYGPREWELPGGSLKRREVPAAAAAREMQEELGLRLPQLEDLGQITGRADRRRDVLYCFGADIGSSPLTPEAGEIAFARWFEWGRLPPALGRYSAAILQHAQPRSS
jgi:ADP-ribose pyrophosphatase YjhB (NUDIX family)